MKKFNLSHAMFNPASFTLYQDADFTVKTFTYPSGVEALKLTNHRGYLTVLPFYGLMIWDAVFDGINLKEKDGFTYPRFGKQITDTYGAFEFNSGLLASGNPSPEDDHVQHGEFATARMDHAALLIEDGQLTVQSDYEYIKGFGDHYLATPAVTMVADSGLFDLDMHVKNLSHAAPMPLQYMCHLCYAYVPGATMTANVPDEAFQLRTSVPAHVHPTPEWTAFTDELQASGKLIDKLDDASHYDPEIVFFSDDLSKYTDTAEFRVELGDGHTFLTKYPTADLPIVTRWILYNGDQQVNAFALPGTSTPEGRLAAKQAGTLIMLPPQAEKHFHVQTGLEK